jgi:predicted O-methyltransferase YrrM
MESATSDNTIVRDLLTRVYDMRSTELNAFVKAGMIVSELVELYGLIRRDRCRSILEIGMANATSSVVMCAALHEQGGGELISVDPFQTDPAHYGGGGMAAIRRAGFEGYHQLIEEPSYIAMPRLIAERRTFDLVLVDGVHSFDYAFVDLFFADLLLKTGGIVAIHDTANPPVYKAWRFFEIHKQYERVSPALMVALPALSARTKRRLMTVLAGPRALAEARLRRERWRTLGAFRKKAAVMVPDYHHVSF